MLVALAVVAVLTYFNFGGFHRPGFVHHWEQFHYFLGSKYFPETGYDGLYVASMGAQMQTDRDLQIQPYLRDLRHNAVVSTLSLEAHGLEVHQRFSPARWRQFEADNRYFLTLRPEYLSGIRLDHGYNPTPTWTFVARLLSSWLPASAETLTLLGMLDIGLLVVLFALLFRTYGKVVGCLALMIFGFGYPWRFYWIGGAFLRLDWLVACGVAICCLRRKRFGLAGGLFGYATMVRIFPAAFLIGPGALAIRHLLQKADVRWARRLAAGFVVAVMVGLGVGCLTGRGPTAWAEFASNLKKHRTTWLTNNVGLEIVLLYDQETMSRKLVDWSLPEPWVHWQEKMDRREERLSPWVLAATLIMGAMLALAATRGSPEEAAVLGVGFIFTGAALTCYYWAMLLLWAIRRPVWMNGAVFLISAGLCAAHLLTPSFEAIYGMMSWALAVFFLGAAVYQLRVKPPPSRPTNSALRSRA